MLNPMPAQLPAVNAGDVLERAAVRPAAWLTLRGFSATSSAPAAARAVARAAGADQA